MSADIETELVARYSEPAPYKKHLGSFRGKRTKAAAELFNNAEQRGARQSYLLDSRNHEGKIFSVRAISLRGDLSEQVVAELTAAAQQLSVGRLFWEGQFAPLLPEAIGSDSDAADTHSLSRLADGIIVFPTIQEGKQKPYSYCVWARQGGDYFIVPVSDDWL
ncbi:hypothetical protein [Psychromicrobium lacuslunae]|uniref:Uncharacterized protein n=1 Tax=Psychromicrobium lacuslunae TaxID=1618207 RepID=A0A0D4BZY7_9MICC|nr:hypothetical protein [Psychromicrobium lacuslunae]AJT41884.1 hypothetical protein UM93_10815 [Psychromicrobium lacuslunae]